MSVYRFLKAKDEMKKKNPKEKLIKED